MWLPSNDFLREVLAESTPGPYWVYRPTPYPKTANKDETRYTKHHTTTHKEKP